MDLTNIIALLVGILGTGIAVYQLAVIRENEKRKHEIQYLLAGIANLTLMKSQSWANQISLSQQFQDAKDLNLYKTQIRARDDFKEINTLVTALEGTIDSENSATLAITQKLYKQGEANQKLNEFRSNQTTANNSAPNEHQEKS